MYFVVQRENSEDKKRGDKEERDNKRGKLNVQIKPVPTSSTWGKNLTLDIQSFPHKWEWSARASD